MPQGKQWIHEIKFDGYRTIARINNGKVQLLTRTGLDWTNKYSSIAEELKNSGFNSAILDGEIVALDKKGRSNFMELQKTRNEGNDAMLQYYIFDILYLDGELLEKRPLSERKKILKGLFKKEKFNNIFFSDSFKITPEEFSEKICKPGYEGIISKLADKAYHSGRSKDWLKSKCQKRQEFVIGGYTLPSNQSGGLGAMLIGYYEGKDLVYCGKVGTGMDHKTSLEMRGKLEKLKQKTPSFKSVSAMGSKGAIYVKPKLVCEVEFTEWTTDGALRHPSFQGLRMDKPAAEIHKDIPLHLNKKK